MNDRGIQGNITIRPMTAGDAATAARLHAEYVGRSVFSMFGQGFLKEIYARLAASPPGIGYICEKDAAAVGFIAASSDTGRLLREIVARGWPRLLSSAAKSVFRHPVLLLRLLETPLYFARDTGPAPSAELLFIAVLPDARNGGIARRLIRTALDQLAAVNACRVKVTVNADNAAVNSLLQSLGFTLTGSFSFYGCRRNRYVSDSPAGGRR